MSGTRDRYFGNAAIDEFLVRAVNIYRDHLELVYPFLLVAILSLFLETRLELVELLYESDEGFRLATDRDVFETLLPSGIADQVIPVFDELLWILVIGIAFIVLLTILATLLASAIAFLLVADISRETNRPQFNRALVAVNRIPALFIAVVLATVSILIGLVFLILPGLYLAGRFGLTGPAIVIGGCGPIEGLRMSWQTADGRVTEIAIVLLLGVILAVLLSFLPVIGELAIILVVLPVVAIILGLYFVDASENHSLYS